MCFITRSLRWDEGQMGGEDEAGGLAVCPAQTFFVGLSIQGIMYRNCMLG